nr:SDR family NAD(P)-dependent oxidoreductase [Bradyrhizobium sp. 186]
MAASVAIVTGASSGIGKATALRLARDFGAVVLAARSGEQLAEVGRQVEAAGAEPPARWMTGTVLRMDGGEIKSV